MKLDETLTHRQQKAVESFEQHLLEHEGGYEIDAMHALVSHMTKETVGAMAARLKEDARWTLRHFCRDILYKEHAYWPFNPDRIRTDVDPEAWTFLKPWILRVPYTTTEPRTLCWSEPFAPMSSIEGLLGHFCTLGVEATLAGLEVAEWRPALLNVAAIVEENRGVMLSTTGSSRPAWEALLAWAQGERERIAALAAGSPFDRAQRAWEERQELNMWLFRENMPDVLTPFLGRFDECGSVDALFARVPRGYHRPIEQHFRMIARTIHRAAERGMRPESIAMIREWCWRNRPAWGSSKSAFRADGSIATSQFDEAWFCPYLLEGGSIDTIVEKKPEFREWIIHLGLLLSDGREQVLEAMRASGRSTLPYETWMEWAEREAEDED